MPEHPVDAGPSDEILNPRAVYEREGEAGLRDRLHGLDRETLEAVAHAHPPHHTTPPALETLSDEELIGYMVDGAERSAR